ncbi:serine/threonine-protein kinase Nek8-like protein [Leptotrombidium deliense]|uniref:non-specific serine/threonine protein kinase n=1 Tax=Leptotrombidium deliense TaxID=299467 RepID=A0A443S7B0_9ACAR|nr:serine/threonine-protein kinase Nek8-like protein [Leptotrombidium deliense]
MLSHPNIVTYFDSFESDGKLLIEMEYCDGGTLATFLQHLTEPLKELEILTIFQQIVSAISYLHDKKILHRDLKTANIFMTKDMVVKVGDFGISKMLNTHKVGASTVVGTPSYLSPEMCKGKSYNQKTDIWALGCILHEIASLQKAFDGANLPALINKIVKGQFAPVKRCYSTGFRQLIKDLLQTDPELRPHAYEIQDDVDELIKKSWCENFHDHFSGDFTTGAVLSLQNPKLNITPRSLLYEVKICDSHVSLERVPFLGNDRIKDFSKSSNHYLVLTSDLLVYSWGCAIKGQLGLDHVNSESTTHPTCIDDLRGKNIVKVCAGEGFSLFMTANGSVMSCGDGSSYCLGHSDSSACYTPKWIQSLRYVDICDIACGTHHAMAVTNSGCVYGWGCNVDGRLGVGRTSNMFVANPTLVTFPSCAVIKKVFCGPNATMFLDNEGYLWACGHNNFNKLGLNEKLWFNKFFVENQFIPLKLKWLQEPVKSVSLSINNCGLLFESGKVMVLGNNDEGQLGHGHVKVLTKSKFVNSLSDHIITVNSTHYYFKITELQCGTTFILASTCEDLVYFWGGRYISQKIDVNQSQNQSQRKRQISECSLGEGSSVSENSDVIVVGNSNWPLMQIVENVGPDYPVLQIRDPRVIVNSAKDLKLLNSPKKFYKRDIILTPQPIISLYSSQVHLLFGETVQLKSVYCSSDDRIFIIVDTTIPCDADKHKLNRKRSKNLVLSVVCEESSSKLNSFRNDSSSSETVPNWVLEEANQCDNDQEACLDTNNSDNHDDILQQLMHTAAELETTKQQLEQSLQLNAAYERQIQELEQHILRIRRRDNKEKLKPCSIYRNG